MMPRSMRMRIIILATGLLFAVKAGAIDFAKEIQPLLAERCFKCHGEKKRKGGLRLTNRRDALAPGDSGKATIVPGDSAASLLIKKISSTEPKEQMPPKGTRLTAAQIDLMRQWIDEGATWPETEPQHWAYVKPKRPPLPQLKSKWPRNGIDHFILARLNKEGLKPSPQAPPEQLLRRVHLDLIGIPPSPTVLDKFLKDSSPIAYEKVVDQLLASPRYGERWARPWLDLARYADSNGFQADQLRDSWAYRDWVIDAFNTDMPFDQFVIEQIAGDLLPNATPAQRIATGFHRTPTCNVEAGVHPEENRVNQIFDRVNTTASVFLGATFDCAQCHNHKYDPFSMKDFYSLFSFFNNTPLEVKQLGNGVTWNFYGPTMDLPISPEQKAKLEELNNKQATQKKVLEDLRAKLKTKQAAWEQHILQALKEEPQWSVLSVENFNATGNPTHKLQKDGSVILTGKNPDKSTYTITTKPDLTKITAIRLEALTDPSMTKDGPGRNFAAASNPNFIVNEFTIKANGKTVKLASVSASFSQNRWDVRGSIDGDPKTGWAINPAFGKPAWAIYKLAQTLELKPSAQLEFSIVQNYGGGRTIGRPRLSAIEGDPSALNLPDNIVAILKKTKRTRKEEQDLEKHFHSEHPELKALELKVLAIDKQIKAVKPGTTLVMIEQDKPRKTNVLRSGNYLMLGEEVTSQTPEALHGFKKEWPNNRLGLAKWLVAPDNPLVGRVTVNRWWAQFMGRGIVATQEDFGTEGAAPTHQHLLDWLAVEFAENGWSMKHLHKQIVMSATYKQSSRVNPTLLTHDPGNELYARAPRLRMSAEMVRDNALTISGLLSTKMHGPPIYPPQPNGIWRHVGRNAPKYIAATDENRFRRGVYVVWRRGAPYASFVNFDAPDRGSCVIQRPRTNTPLQALTLMNDEAYVEIALAFAGRILSEKPNTSTADRIAHAFKSSLSRAPKPEETLFLEKLLQRRMVLFQKEPASVKNLLDGIKGWKAPEGMNLTELAAWFYVANILLNLDETITKG